MYKFKSVGKIHSACYCHQRPDCEKECGIIISHRVEGPGREIFKLPLSVCPSVCLFIHLSVSHVPLVRLNCARNASEAICQTGCILETACDNFDQKCLKSGNIWRFNQIRHDGFKILQN